MTSLAHWHLTSLALQPWCIHFILILFSCHLLHKLCFPNQIVFIASDSSSSAPVPNFFPCYLLPPSPQTTGLTVLNTGSSWKVDLPAEGSSLTGGALQGEYKVSHSSSSSSSLYSSSSPSSSFQAWQMHAHWGSCAGESRKANYYLIAYYS